MNTILACVDEQGSPMAVCDGATWAATILKSPLTFLHVIDRHPEKASQLDFSGQIGLGAQENLLQELSQLDERRSVLAQEQGRQLLEGARARATMQGALSVDARQRHGELVDTLMDLEADASLIVLGTHEHKAWTTKRHLDHHVERVIRSVKRPVLVIPQTAFVAPGSFAVAYDGSAAASKMVEALASSPLLQGLSCHLVHVGADTAGMRSEVSRASQVLTDAGWTVQTAIENGEVEETLSRYVATHHLHLVVMGAYGHTRIRNLIVGSTTTTMLRSSAVPVLVWR
ncbi:MAG: universal stress protein [Aquabacterium sp.]|uniref:universal stress protein n=1 Tax=Aquabacterium sp. TaxID=1872578 RepID=UPI0027230316|nr:universal stress protein [Aquabacterium sp.]MDO9004364.1 universal stress protein [Aquabacterium sp.]